MVASVLVAVPVPATPVVVLKKGAVVVVVAGSDVVVATGSDVVVAISDVVVVITVVVVVVSDVVVVISVVVVVMSEEVVVGSGVVVGDADGVDKKVVVEDVDVAVAHDTAPAAANAANRAKFRIASKWQNNATKHNSFPWGDCFTRSTFPPAANHRFQGPCPNLSRPQHQPNRRQRPQRSR